MEATPTAPSIPRPFAARGVRVLLACCTLAWLACIGHALWLDRMGDVRFAPAHALVKQHLLSAPSLSPHDDLRHPAWGRAEQARAGQPLLVDPRPATRFVSPIPLRVQP